MAVPATKAIVFDCFGVLYLDAKQSLLNTLPADRARELADVFMQNNYGMLTREEYVKAVSDISGMSGKDFETFASFEHRLNTVLIDEIRRLKKTYKIGLLSNIGRGWIHEFFDAHQLHDLFDEVVLSGEEGITKPHPRIFELMCERLELEPEECIMIDDIEANCSGADAVGMRSVHFRTNEQCLHDLHKLLASSAL
jgi:putative hydrolase of the HAD superfamily